jgi:hypothetical protein
MRIPRSATEKPMLRSALKQSLVDRLSGTVVVVDRAQPAGRLHG